MMRLAVTFLLAVALASGSTIPKRLLRKLQTHSRIVGGNETTIEANPWQVSLTGLGIHNCGGSIIAPDVILTAAHCDDGFLSPFYEVLSGATDLLDPNIKRSTYKKIIVHDLYDGHSNDVALIILNEPLTFDDKTQAIPLADTEPAAGSTVTITGWGALHDGDLITPNLLHTVDVQVVDRAECAADYVDVENAVVDDTMFCAGVPEGGKDSCQGDSGGPVTQDGVVVGIVSWGLGCALKGYPGANTNVANVREWIKQNSGV